MFKYLCLEILLFWIIIWKSNGIILAEISPKVKGLSTKEKKTEWSKSFIRNEGKKKIKIPLKSAYIG